MQPLPADILMQINAVLTHQSNYDIRTIQEMLGHSDVRTTMIYPVRENRFLLLTITTFIDGSRIQSPLLNECENLL